MERKGDPQEWRASNGNRLIGTLPPDGLALLNDPRLEGMTDPLPGFTATTRELRPAEIVNFDLKYFRLQRGLKADPQAYARWVNKPERGWGSGWGLGFDDITERPRIEQPKKAPKRLFHLWVYNHFFVASPDMVSLLQRECPGSFQTVPIDWIFNDGNALDGYVFLDVIRLEHPWDYQRSVVIVEMNHGRKSLRLGNHEVQRQDIPADAKIFRDAYHRYDVFVSRELAIQILQLAGREMSLRDMPFQELWNLPVPRAPRNLQARLKSATPPVDDESLPLDRRMSLRILPLIEQGEFAHAETVLTEWLRARPATPYHVVTELRITTSPEACAEFLDAFYLRAQAEHPVKAVYIEMNGFTINPDLWFCDAFGFRQSGDEDGSQWLGAFDSSSEESLVITGLEPLQAVFDAQLKSGPLPGDQQDARRLAVALVIVKFEALLQAAVPLTKYLKCPLWATAHDHYEFLARIARK